MPITLDREEEIRILENIARNSESAVARIQALRRLDELRRYEQVPEGFEALYAVDGPTPRRAHSRPPKPPAA